jgi:predicted ribosome quality control (RQC) complex YloA/Tae2 family protein
MSLNWKEINLILEELSLPGAQIQKAVQPSFDTLGLHVYGGLGGGRGRLIIISLSPGACRIHECFRAMPKSEKPLRFAEFLKSRIVNGYIEEAVQLGDNRIVRLAVKRGENRYLLYIRLWSNAANVIVTDPAGTILDAMRRLPKRGEVTGGVYLPEENTSADGTGGKPEKEYEVRVLDGEGSFNQKIDAWYAEHGGGLSLEKLKEKAQKKIAMSLNRLEAALERLREKKAEYANAGALKQRGDELLTAGEVKAAEEQYEKYRKAKNGLADVVSEIAEGEAELERLRAAEEKLLAQTNPLILERLIAKLGREGLGRNGLAAAPGDRAGKKRPGLSFMDSGWLIIVGRDAKENDELLRRHVKGNDLWLHARDFAGSYVFIKQRAGKTVPLDILLDAGNLALFYSKGRNNGSGNCYYTQVKYLRRVKGAKTGLVIPTQEKNLSVKTDEKRLKKLEDLRVLY